MIDIPAQAFGRRWYTVFGLLSMEIITPFLDEMGLDFIDINVVRPYIRQYIESYEREWVDDGLLQLTFSQIAGATDVDTALMLYDWGMKQFPLGGSEGAREFIWTVLLQRLAGVGHITSDPVLSLPQDKVKAIIEVIRDHLGMAEDGQNLWQRIDAAEAPPLSEWDRRIYSVYSADGESPMDRVLEVIRFQRFQRVWSQIKQMLKESELDTLLQWGKTTGQHMNMSTELVKLPD